MRHLGSGLRIGIVHARWNTKIIDALLAGTKKALAKSGVKDENIVIQSVPGSYELPYAVKQYARPLSQWHDAATPTAEPCVQELTTPLQTLLRLPSSILLDRHRRRSRRPPRLCIRPHLAHDPEARDFLAALRRRHCHWCAHQG
jgi:hypothetical protein